MRPPGQRARRARAAAWLETLLLLPAEPTTQGMSVAVARQMQHAACEHPEHATVEEPHGACLVAANGTLPALEHIDITGSPDHDHPYTAHESADVSQP